MYLFPKLSAKASGKNIVYLVDAKDKLSSLKLNNSLQKYIQDKFKDSDFVVNNSDGNFQVFCKTENLDEDKNKEKCRHLGFKVCELLKNEVEAFHITGGTKQSQELFIEGFALSTYSFKKYFTKPPKLKLKSYTYDNKQVDSDKIEKIVDVTTWARELVNEPVSYLTAEQLAKEIVKKTKGTKVKAEVLGQSKIESLKMGGLLAVNKGSVDPATFTILEYKPKKYNNKKPYVLVGKGIVYDTGGLSLKPTKGSMDSMKCDMAGAAAMAATIIGVANLNLPIHMIALIPATDNRPGGNAYTPGDVITMFDGTKIEVLNTDAEGRMILADALSYAKKYKPELVIDAATLTGAAAAAIGPYATIAMGNAKQKEFDVLNKAGFATHDRIVQFPFWDEYKDEMKSTIADMKNVGGSFAGMITAGKFLEHFTDYPYIHLDIAGPAFNNSKDSYRGLGGTGCGVRLLIEFFSQKA